MVVQEGRVSYQPTPSGIGRADYVLRDDNGKPLAVIEAKSVYKDAREGCKQAALYADGLEKMYGQRPVIFYTNGIDIWIWDDAQGYGPRKIYGFYSKDSLQYMVTFQRHNRRLLDEVEASPKIAARLYQLEALKQVCERFSNKHRKALIVQATGTGKTRVAISLTALLIRAGWLNASYFCATAKSYATGQECLCDFLDEPLVVVGRDTAKDRNKRIYLATYPAMMKVFETFDVGFF